ncbi:MAG: hypothetical protein B7Y58_08555 [Halothiobacillus sp. 35-54-62]|nr:transglycosylase SLT domain-containing protein [Halothiobacillaceae bacterium]OYY33907.1 MAG: hypothetical protein B7Y58_08555 [Halothiobacillus sp. 35-54-62]
MSQARCISFQSAGCINLQSALTRVESGGKPWAINVNDNYILPRQPQNKAEANRLIGLGYNIDMGVMQINVKNLGMLKLSIDEVFYPCGACH